MIRRAQCIRVLRALVKTQNERDKPKGVLYIGTYLVSKKNEDNDEGYDKGYDEIR